MPNMQIWNDLAKPPEWALKKITAGRLKGKSDINPQWRYEAMTKQFGLCGEGWKYTIDKLWVEQAAHGCIMAFALITLCVKNGDAWTEGIPGIGGNQMVQVESAGLHSNDECYKMAVTDALSVACKMIGVGADVYKGLSDSKYSNPPEGAPTSGDDNKPWLNETMPAFLKARKALLSGEKKLLDIRKVYKVSKKIAELLEAPDKDGCPINEPPPLEENGLPF